MISEKTYTVLKKTGWALFFLIFALEVINIGIRVQKNVLIHSLPFDLSDGIVTDIRDSSLVVTLKNKIVVRVDSLDVIFQAPMDPKAEKSRKPHLKIDDNSVTFNVSSGNREDQIEEERREFLENFDSESGKIIRNKPTVTLTVQDTLTGVTSTLEIRTHKTVNKKEIYSLLAIALLVAFTFFNSYILLQYSQASENIFVVLFLMFLVAPGFDYLPISILSKIWSLVISPFWGILFYHFIVIKTASRQNMKILYLQTLIIYLVVFGLNFFKFGRIFEIVIYVWPGYWLLRGFINLRREYKTTGSIEQRRLLNAFKGISITLSAILVCIGAIMAIAILLPGSSALFKSDLMPGIIGGIFGVVIIGSIAGVFIGIFWFFGSFTWSMLTGTALDVKIRSTLIYTIIGVLFVGTFGLIDYALGELLQSLFGKFVGSQFIAGIPGTILMLMLFMPIREKVTRLVDNKLNTSELDFLERTDSFTRNLSDEGVVEGFEEYICENLINRLPIEKVALISFDDELGRYKFNEVRGGEPIVENSIVEDSKNVLVGRFVHHIHEETIDDPQDASSFSIIFPIVFESQHKWFLALGRKNDGSIYNKNDIESMMHLVDKIKLSLKFILDYEAIVAKKYERALSEKDRLIEQLRSGQSA
ncbi:MAG: hypothetical protein PHW79_04715 [Candidatus Marinimicrobia bacterium]|nr:hypothetical protein [Candidatus Neomarinimicrobiota bacterium]